MSNAVRVIASGNLIVLIFESSTLRQTQIKCRRWRSVYRGHLPHSLVRFNVGDAADRIRGHCSRGETALLVAEAGRDGLGVSRCAEISRQSLRKEDAPGHAAG